MRTFAASSIAFSLAASLVSVASLDACGGSVNGVLSDGAVGDGGGDLPEASRDAGPPPGEPLSLFGAYAVKTIFLGETDRTNTPVKDAWKSYGENLDGLVTGKTDTNVCKRQAGADAAKQEDGIGGIDNSFGRTVLGFIGGIAPAPSKSLNEAIAKGDQTPMLNLLPAEGPLSTRFGLLSAAPTNMAMPPLFDGTDVRAAGKSSVGSGPEDALSISTTPSMNGRRVASGIASGTFFLTLPLQGTAWRIPIRHARVTMTISDDGLRATTGTISGISPTEELVDSLAKVAGRISSQLCAGSTLDTIKQTLRQASDIPVDGPQDPSKACDGISIGIGFEAVKVTASGVAPDGDTGVDPCQ